MSAHVSAHVSAHTYAPDKRSLVAYKRHISAHECACESTRERQIRIEGDDG